MCPKIWWMLFVLASSCRVWGAESDRPPNIIIIFTDDQGYGDLGCYGEKQFKTPNLDRLASEGIRFTDFYVAQAVCSSSRTALLTGCYPNRIGITGALGPNDRHGINSAETTLGELCRSRGYATAAVGKWHLGRQRQFLPLQHGFDSYFGLPYSNDMWPNHPTAGKNYPELPLLDGNDVWKLNPDQSQLTSLYTDRALSFIDRNAHRPFFLYLAHSMPHVPLFVSEKFRGKSEKGLFGDVIEEIDWSVGRVLETLERLKIDRQTLVMFTCDNGPWLVYGNHGGSAGALREGKGTSFEGGVRVPFLARWPGKIPAGKTCREPAMTIDLLPTIARLTGAPLVDNKINNRLVDGLDIWPLLAAEPGAKSPRDVLYFYWLNRLDAVRSGKWKLHVPHDFPHPSELGRDGTPGKIETRRIPQSLYNLETDLGESTDLSAEFPEVVKMLLERVEAARADLGDSAVGSQGAGIRSPGRLPE